MKKIISIAIALVMLISVACAISLTAQAENDITTNLLYKKGAPSYIVGSGAANAADATDGIKTQGNLANILLNMNNSNNKGSFYYDLGDVYSLEDLIHTHDHGHVATNKNEKIDVVISLSSDASDWTEVGGFTIVPQAERLFAYTVDFEGKTGRFIKYDVTTTNSNNKEPHFQAVEIEVYGSSVTCDHAETEIIPAVEPTCSSVGYTQGEKCTNCGHLISEPKEVEKLPHTEEIIPAEGDYTEGKKCSVCGEVTVAPTLINRSLLAGLSPTITLGDEQHTKVYATNGAYNDLANLLIHLNKTSMKGSFYYDLGAKYSLGKLVHTHNNSHVAVGKNESIEVIVSVSDDLSVWTQAGAFTVIPGTTEYTINLSGYAGQYIKYDVTLNNPNGKEPHFQVAEIDLYENTGCAHQNKETIAAVAPTCTTDGATEGVKCLDCDEIITEPTVIPAAHTYNGGDYCSVCKTFNKHGLEYATIALGSDIAVRYYMVNSGLESLTDIKLTATTEYAGSVVLTPIEATVDGINYLVFTFEDVSPSKIGDIITTVLTAKDGEETVTGEELTYSVLEYCMNTLDSNEISYVRAICMNLVHFAADVQAVVDYKTDAPVNAEALEKNYIDGVVYPKLESYFKLSDVDGVLDIRSASVALTSSVVVRFKIAAPNADPESLKASINGQEVEIEAGADGINYYVFYEAANVADYAEKIELSVTDGENTATLDYSVSTYALRMIEAEGENSVYAKLLKYVQSVIAYKSYLATIA